VKAWQNKAISVLKLAEAALRLILSVTDFAGPPIGIHTQSDVTFDGETLSFTRQGRQGAATQMSLKLKSATLTGSLTTPGGDLPIVAKKSA
jgi:hypothetical protein